MSFCSVFGRIAFCRNARQLQGNTLRSMSSDELDPSSRAAASASAIESAVAKIKAIPNIAALDAREKRNSRPFAPGPEDCCMSGCATCIWDFYEDDIKFYNATRRAILDRRVELLAERTTRVASDSPEQADQAAQDLAKAKAAVQSAVDDSASEIDPQIRALRDFERELKRKETGAS